MLQRTIKMCHVNLLGSIKKNTWQNEVRGVANEKDYE